MGEFLVSYGTTELGVAIAPRASTRFRIASNTKTMTAAVIMQLAEEGKITLDGRPTANTIALKVLDQIYAVSPQ